MARSDPPIQLNRDPVPMEAPRDLRDYLTPLRLHKWLIVALTLAGLVLGWGAGARSGPTYVSTTEILVGPGVVDPTSPLPGTSGISLTTEADIATSRSVAREARSRIQTDESLDELLGHVSTSFGPGSTVLVLRFSADTPDAARQGAAAFAQAYLDFRARPMQASLDERIGAVQGELTTLRQSYADLTAQIEDSAISSGQLLKIQTEAQLLESDIGELSTELSRLEGLTVDAGTIIAGASQPSGPSSGGRQTKATFAVIGALLGMFIGVVAAFTLEASSDALRGLSDLEDLTNAPALGLVHAGRGRGKRPFVISARDDPVLLQDIRAIRSALQNLAPDSGHRRFLVASSSQRDGRTTIAASLAAVLASADTQVILMSADLHAPALEALFDVSPEHDLIDVLEGRAGLDDVLLPTSENGLWVVAGRPVPSDRRGDLLESEAMANFLAAAGERADFVILDSPPLVVADALALASRVDGVIYLADDRRAKRHRVARASVSIEQAGGVLVGSVLNRFVARRAHRGSREYRSEERQRRRYLSMNGSGGPAPALETKSATDERA